MDDFVYNEDLFVRLDAVLDSARRWGCKIVLPIINQDYGSQDSNWNVSRMVGLCECC
jgi:hypothetical protein